MGEIQKIDTGSALAAQAPRVDVAMIIQSALASGRPMGEIKEALEVAERVEGIHREQAFNAALSAFQNEIKTIEKNRQVDFVSQKGGKVKYSFVDLENLIEQIRPVLEKHGFAFSHDTAIDSGQMMTVTCTLRHVGGHREKSSFTLPTTAQTSLMSDQQRYAAALTFARRYTLIQILGLATGDADPDDITDPTTITEEQQRSLNDALIEVQADRERFLKFMGVSKLADIRAADLSKAWQAIDSKRKGQK